MSYTRPDGDAANFRFATGTYTRPDGDAANFSFVESTDVPRTRIVAATRSPWGVSLKTERQLRAVHDVSAPAESRVAGPWGEAAPLQEPARVPWVVSVARDDGSGSPWGVYTGRAQPSRNADWTRAIPADDASASPWGHYERRLHDVAPAPWVRSVKADDASISPWGGPMLAVDLARMARFPQSAGRDRRRWVPWTRFSRILQPGWGVVIPVHPPSDPPEALYVIPVRPIYMQVNNTSLRRVDGDVPLPTYSLSIRMDQSSWVWSFSASLPASLLEHVEPDGGDPIEVEANVNGALFRFLVRTISRDRTFAASRINISGQGKAVLLDAPFAPRLNFTNASSRTLAQLMDDALTFASVSLGWTVNFGPDDWLVPAGVWSFDGTHIGALNRLAEAAGAYVQAHPTAMEFDILPLYPTAPWDWSEVEPDYEIPSSLATREGIEWIEMPKYNRVYVSGTRDGVLGRVTRALTAGDVLAPMVTDPLTTTAAAARQRGLPILANTGRIAKTTLRMPVLSETLAGGVIAPGKFVRYVDGAVTRLGIVRSTEVSMNGVADVWQNFEIETHD